MSKSKPKLAVFYQQRPLSYDNDWLEAIGEHFPDTVFVSVDHPPDDRARFAYENADLVVFAHATNCMGCIIPIWMQWSPRKGKAVLFAGNEYKHQEEKNRVCDALGIEYVASMVPIDSAREIYGPKAVAFPHALNPKLFRPSVPRMARPFDIGYRGYRHNPERERIVAAFDGMNSDIQIGEVMPREQWAQALNQWKAIPSTEAGDAETNTLCISSRHWEAIGTQTVQVMYPGRFNDILTADEHYISLEREHSNMDQVKERLADPAECHRIAHNALNLAMDGHTYAHRMKDLEALA